jgi:hypothetical protein
MQLKANLIVISHIKIIMDQESGAIIGTEPLLPGQLAGKIPGYFDEVYYSFAKAKEGKTVYRLQTQTKGLYKARSRISGEEGILPIEIPNNYTELIKAIAAGKEKVK